MIDQIEFLDVTIIVLYIIGIFLLALFSGRKAHKINTLEDQYLAGKSLTLFESLCSIIATEVSALTFLGIPAFAIGADFSFVQIYFGAIFGRLLIATVMLPKVYNQGLTIYSAMGAQGNQGGQRAISLFYSINKFLAVGVRLFSGSIMVAAFLQINIYLAVALISTLTFFYTLIGGLKAVVRTDIIQMALFISGGVIAHFIIPDVAGVSWSELMSAAHIAGKTSFINLNDPSAFIIGVFGGILFDMATHGVDQDFAQRLTANRSIKEARIAIVSSSFLSIFVGFLFLSVGALLWQYYQLNQKPDLQNDMLFANFIVTYFPVGIRGLMVAGVLAATMSTLDSTINALSSCLHNDILNTPKNLSAKELEKHYRRDTLIITIILLAVAFIASKSEGLLLFGLKITSWTAGSLLSVFFATLVFKIGRLNFLNVTSAYILGVFGVYLNTFHIKANWNFNVYFGFILGLIGFYLSEKIFKEKTH